MRSKQRRAAWATAVTGTAAAADPHAAAHRRPPAPLRSAIPKCQGLAFMFVSKFGLGLGVDSGHGFVIKRRPVRAVLPSRGAPLLAPALHAGWQSN